MAQNMDRRIALVTGSTSGIGLATARALAASGCDIFLHGFGEPGQITDLKGSLAAEFGVRVEHSAHDLSRPENATEMVKEARAKLGDIEILVNNAGIQHVAPIEDFTMERWNAILNVNLTAVFAATQAVLPAMKKRRTGRIINIASVHGLVASIHKSAYVAAKHGLVGLTKVTALETALDGITCNAICPGWVKTVLIEKQIQARAEQKHIDLEAATADLIGEKQPNQKFATTEQIAALVAFLASPAAASMTGTILPVDGGWTAQ